MSNVQEYIQFQQYRLSMLKKMWGDPYVQLYNDETLPQLGTKKQITVFLAGPTSRGQIAQYNWRSEAVHILRDLGYDGWIYVPEPRGKETKADFTDSTYIYNWESTRLFSASHVVFWIPRNSFELLGLNTNLELGMFLGKLMSRGLKKQKLFVGWPDSAERMGLPSHYLKLAGIENPYRFIWNMLEEIAHEE